MMFGDVPPDMLRHHAPIDVIAATGRNTDDHVYHLAAVIAVGPHAVVPKTLAAAKTS